MNKLIENTAVRVEDLCCLVLDEAHSTKGESPYQTLVAKVVGIDGDKRVRPLLLGMSASPLETIGNDVGRDAIALKIQELARRIQCRPCYPCENDPYDNGISHTKDVAIYVSVSEEELKFRKKLDDYLRDVVAMVKDRLSTIVPTRFHKMEQILEREGDTLDTDAFKGKLRKIDEALDSARDAAHTTLNEMTLVHQA